jgi:hypothetical protein
MIDYLVLDNNQNREFSNSKTGRVLGPFGNINVFVGKNNSGKSRFLRSVFINENNSCFDINKLNKDWIVLTNQLVASIASLGNPYGVRSAHQQKYAEFSKIISEQYFVNPSRSKFVEFIGSFEMLPKVNGINIPILDDQRNINQITELAQKTISDLQSSVQKVNVGHHLYIPILRGLRPIQQDPSGFTNSDVYGSRTKKDYNIQHPTAIIYTGLTMYEDVKKLLLGTEEDRNLIAEFQIFLGKFIFEEKVTLIPKYETDVLHIKIGDKPQLEIFNLGDGLQTIISILFPIFIQKNNELRVFIEEPETHLHPEWQGKLLLALKQFENHQFFISSHSNIFINDSSTSVFSVKNNGDKIFIDDVNEKNLLSVLKDLGYKASDLLLSNYILWVEGQSDKIYFNSWLKLEAPHLKEGQHYSIMVIGGENYRHLLSGEDGGFNLELLEKMNPNYGIVLDSDKESPRSKISESKLKIKELFDKKGSFCWITEKREIENYIPDNVFRNAIMTYSQKSNIQILSGPYDNRNKVIDHDIKPSLKSNIRIPDEFFKKIQKYGTDAIKNAKVHELRSMLIESLSKNSSQEFEIKKIKVAKEISKCATEVPYDVRKKLITLVEHIEKAN